MITLSTGLPGHGKTLFTLFTVNELAKKEGRPVFYSGISNLSLDWHEIEAERWMDCPDGAIIVIDECQRIFRPRGNGSKVPEFVSALETHRHKGVDIFLVTQHPMLVDANVRRLTERHFHISRKFGMERATIFQFESCKDQPLSVRSQAQRYDWKYPKEVYSYYKSAELHTVKRRIPIQYVVMFAMPVLTAAIVYYFIQRHYNDGEFVTPGISQDVSTAARAAPVSSGAASAPVTTSARDKKTLTPKEYVESYVPRVDGLAYTAPVYDEVTKPVRAPVPVGAVISKKGCVAYTDQGTRLAVPDMVCRHIASYGFYREFDNVPLPEPKKEAKKEVQQVASAPADSRVPHFSSEQEIPVVAPVVERNDSTNPRYNVALRGKDS